MTEGDRRQKKHTDIDIDWHKVELFSVIDSQIVGSGKSKIYKAE